MTVVMLVGGASVAADCGGWKERNNENINVHSIE